jgi:hypothetical protein
MKARAIMKSLMKETLMNLKTQVFSWDTVKESTKPLADAMRERLKGTFTSPSFSSCLVFDRSHTI